MQLPDARFHHRIGPKADFALAFKLNQQMEAYHLGKSSYETKTMNSAEATLSSVARSLSDITLLKCLTASELSTVERDCEWRYYNSKDRLFSNGSGCDDVFFLVAGEVEIVGTASSGSQYTIARAASGDTVGEMAAIDHQPRSASVIASRNSLVAVLEGKKFHELVKLHGDIGLALLNRFSSMVRTGDDSFVELRVHNERMETELNIARDIQLSMVPLTFPAFPDRSEFTIFGGLTPAREVGGDFFDFFFITEDRFCCCIGDVSGKGVPAALFMAVAKTLIKSRAKDDYSTASIIAHVNDELSLNNNENMFVTLFIAIVDLKNGNVNYTNAGHNPPYVIKNNGELKCIDERHGPIAGVMVGMTYGEDTYRLERGDILLLYTDGVTEAVNSENELFSDIRLEELLNGSQVHDAKKTVEQIVGAVKEYEDAADQTDDITVLAFQYHDSTDSAAYYDSKIVIKNHLSELSAVVAEFDEFGKKHDLRDDISTKFKIIIDELGSNIIKYAYDNDDEHEIIFQFELTESKLTASVTDDGMPFNPLDSSEPDVKSDLEDREVGGLGIHLVRNLVDDVRYQRRAGQNVLTLVKNIKRKPKLEKNRNNSDES